MPPNSTHLDTRKIALNHEFLQPEPRRAFVEPAGRRPDNEKGRPRNASDAALARPSSRSARRAGRDRDGPQRLSTSVRCKPGDDGPAASGDPSRTCRQSVVPTSASFLRRACAAPEPSRRPIPSSLSRSGRQERSSAASEASSTTSGCSFHPHAACRPGRRAWLLPSAFRPGPKGRGRRRRWR